MTGEYVGAIDQGTTGTRVMLFDRGGRIAANAYAGHEQFYPEPGWVEHDPVEIWENARALLREALAEAGVGAEDLAALGVTNQRETTLLWDRETGEPLHDAIVWQDRRTTGRVEELEAEGRSGEIRAKTGLEPDAYFSATKVEWLLDELGRDRVGEDVAFGTIDSWLIYNLTGEHVTDVTNASRTMLFDIHDLEWDGGLLEEFGVPEGILPEVRPSSDDGHYGRTDGDLLGAPVPVAGALGDQQAALFGQTCFDPGDAKNTYGTGSFLLANTGREAVESDHGLLTTVGFQRSGDPPNYALEGSIFSTGAAIEWLVDLGLIEEPAEVETLARGVDSTDGVYLVPAFAGLGAPHWDGRARGTVVGLTRGTGPGHVARATLEAIAYQTRDVVEAMEADSGIGIDALRVDGGAVKNDLLCRIQADLLGAEVVRPVVDETTALGAAYAAGLATGYWESVDDLRENWREDGRFVPEMDPEEADRKYARWEEALDRARDWARD